MEVRKQPRTEHLQRCLSFDLLVSPKTRVMSYRDYLGNNIHHFTVPGKHAQLQIVAESKVETGPPPPLPDRLPDSAWQEIDQMVSAGDYWEFLMPSDYARPTPLLKQIAIDLGAERREDPLSLLAEINTGMYAAFEYVPRSTTVDSPIDDALRARRGVCQDFAHIMIALVREYLRIPIRYVSGYLFHGRFDHDRSSDGATHAWVEALLPGVGWVGLDPTNNLLAGERHIRTAVGRDYGDVPPTHGTFKGSARSELFVAVQVSQSDSAPPLLDEQSMGQFGWIASDAADDDFAASLLQQQQQQQQQQ